MRERLKSVLLALLILLTLYLTLRVWLYDEALLNAPAMAWAAPLRPLLGFHSPESSAEPGYAPELAAPCAWPVKISVNASGVRLGAAWDAARSDALTAASTELLREALDTAGAPEPVSPARWREALRGDCVYYEYGSALPVQVLAAWASASCGVRANARVLALSVAEDGVALWYKDTDGGGYFRAETRARPALPDISASGAQPCFFLFERPQALPGADGDTMVMDGGAARPDVAASRSDATLFCLPFLTELRLAGDNYYEEEDGRVYVDNLRTCRVSDSGGILYGNPALLAQPDEGEPDAVRELELARRLLATLSRALGDGRMELSGMEGGTYSFAAHVGGVPVSGGARATVTFRGGEIASAEVYLRQYALTDRDGLLLPVRQAAALLPEGARLGLCYPDTGGERLRAQWRAEREEGDGGLG